MALPAAPEVPGFGALSPLGAGPTSTIFSAHSEQMGRWVALTIYSATPHDRDFNEFRRAYELGRRLGVHPHAVTMLDWGVTPDRRPYVVTEFYEHGTFDSRVSGHQPLPVDKTLRIGVALAGALETAHRADVIHGGVHPARILADSDDEPSLADLGLVPLVGPTGTDALLGPTNYHAPPELLEDDGLSPASDVYSLASTLYTLLTARPPYASSDPEDTSAALLLRALRHEVPPIDRHDVPESLQAALRNALRSDPRQRPAGILAFAQTLQAIQREIGAPVTDPVLLDVAPGLKVVAENDLAEPVRHARAESSLGGLDAQAPAPAAPAVPQPPGPMPEMGTEPAEPHRSADGANKLVPQVEPHPGTEPTPAQQVFVPYPVPELEEHPWFGPPVLDPPVSDPPDEEDSEPEAAAGLAAGIAADLAGANGAGDAGGAGAGDLPPADDSAPPQPGWASLLADEIAASQNLGDPPGAASEPPAPPGPSPAPPSPPPPGEEADGPPLHQRLASAWPAQPGPPAATPGLLPQAEPAPQPPGAPVPSGVAAPSPAAGPSSPGFGFGDPADPGAPPASAFSAAPFSSREPAPEPGFGPEPALAPEPRSAFAPPQAEPAVHVEEFDAPAFAAEPDRADRDQPQGQNVMVKGPRALPVIVLALIVVLLFVAAAWMVVSGGSDDDESQDDPQDQEEPTD